MKTQILHSNPVDRFSIGVRRLISAGSTLLVGAAMTQALVAEETASEAKNSITLSMGGASVSGDSAAFQKRARSDGDFYGGIESLEISQQINKDTTLSLTGHAIPGLEDYGFELMAERESLGYIKAGFNQFRTWYDATGGSLQGANMLASNVFGLLDDERSIDRGEIFLDAGLRMEDIPEITFKYRHLYREGDKDSTSWGDSKSNDNWAAVGSTAGGYDPQFKFMPALLMIDESADIFELDAEHTLGNTDLGLGFAYEHYELDNSRYTPRWSSGVGGSTPANINSAMLNERNKSDVYAGHAYGVTRFNEKAWLSYAAAYSNLNSDIDGGTRSYTYGLGNVAGSRDYSYDQMTGGSKANQFVTNLNFMWVPVKDLTVTPSLRYENESVDTVSNFRAYNTTAFSGGVGWGGQQSLGATTDMDSITSAIDLRYTGVDNFVFFANASVGNENEHLLRIDRILTGEFLATDVDVEEIKMLMGCNWYAKSNLSFSVQGFRETRDQALDHGVGNQTKALLGNSGAANNFRPIMLDHNTDVDDINLRMTWRPVNNVALVTRYDYSLTQYENRGVDEGALPASQDPLRLIESGEIASHIVSQSVTWSPLAEMYVQGSVSWISSETETPEIYTGSSESDCLVSSLTTGYALDQKTELTATYAYYQAENYSNSLSFGGVNTMGFGFNTEEHMMSLTVARALTENMTLSVRYAFITNNTTSPDQSGGVNDFDAHMISSGLQVRF